MPSCLARPHGGSFRAIRPAANNMEAPAALRLDQLAANGGAAHGTLLLGRAVAAPLSTRSWVRRAAQFVAVTVLIGQHEPRGEASAPRGGRPARQPSRTLPPRPARRRGESPTPTTGQFAKVEFQCSCTKLKISLRYPGAHGRGARHGAAARCRPRGWSCGRACWRPLCPVEEKKINSWSNCSLHQASLPCPTSARRRTWRECASAADARMIFRPPGSGPSFRGTRRESRKKRRGLGKHSWRHPGGIRISSPCAGRSLYRRRCRATRWRPGEG